MGNKKFSYVHQDQSRRCYYERRVGSTYPCRSLSGSVKNAVDGVVLAAIQIAEDPSTEATVPPRSSHVRLGDVSSFLIQQGVEERLMENRQHDGVVVMVEKNSSRASPKHRGRRRCNGRGRAAPRHKLCWLPSLCPTIYRWGGEVRAP